MLFILFEDNITWKIGNGEGISFWEDNWAGCATLKSVYPRLFSLSSIKDTKVSKLGDWSNGVWEWKVAWRRRLFVWEKALENFLDQVCQERCPSLGEEDRWVLKDGELPEYTVNSAYKCLRRCVEEENISVYNNFLRCKATPSTLVSARRVLENKIVTRVNLEKRGIMVDGIFHEGLLESCKKMVRKLWRCVCKILLRVVLILKVHDRYDYREVRPAQGMWRKWSLEPRILGEAKLGTKWQHNFTHNKLENTRCRLRLL